MSDFQMVFLIDLAIGLLIGWFLMWLYWRRRFDRLRRELRQVSAEKNTLSVQLDAVQNDIRDSRQRVSDLQAANNDLSAQLALAEVKLEERGLRPIDELAWETKLDSATSEIRRLRDELDAVQRQRPVRVADRLQQINGIGNVFARRLNDAGIVTFAQLAALSAEEVRVLVRAEEWQAIDPASWIEQAQTLSAAAGD